MTIVNFPASQSQCIPCCLQPFQGYTKTKNLSGMLGLIPLAVLSSAVYRVDYTHNICCLLLFAFAFCRPLYACVCVCFYFHFDFYLFSLLVLKYVALRCFFPSAYTVDLNVFHPRVPIFFHFHFQFAFLFIFFFYFVAFSRGLFVVLFLFFRMCVCVCVCLFFFSWLPVGLTVELSISR